MPPKNAQKKKMLEMLTNEVKKIRKSDPANLTCVDCFKRATPYVNLTFCTFICADCAGIHRKYSHRVKSISIATFTKDEVEKLREAGGNSAADAKYLASYRKGRDAFTLPTETEREKVETFIKLKYIDKKWYKEGGKKKEKKKNKNKKKRSKRRESESESEDDDKEDDDDEEPTPPKKSGSKRNSRVSSRNGSRRASQTQSPGQQSSFVQSQPTINEQPKQEPVDDLLSFGAMDPQPTQPQTNQQTSAPADDDWAFGGTTNNNTTNNNANTGATSSGWSDDPFGAPPAASSGQGNASQQTDDLFSGFDSGTTTQPPVQASTSNDMFASFGQAQPTQQQQAPQSSGFGFGQPAQQQQQSQPGYGMQQNMGGFGMQGNMGAGFGQPAQPAAPQGASFLGALGAINAEAEAAKKKAQEEAAAKAQAEANAASQATAKKEEGDPFADLMGTIDLGTGGPAQGNNMIGGPGAPGGGPNRVSANATPVGSTMQPNMQPMQMGLGASAQPQGGMYYQQNQYGMPQQQRPPSAQASNMGGGFGMQQGFGMQNQYMAQGMQQQAPQQRPPSAGGWQQPNQYAMPQQQPNPYGVPQQNPYGMQQPQANPYAAPTAAAASGSDNPFR